jgi:DNA-binding transcriptional MerR regulator
VKQRTYTLRELARTVDLRPRTVRSYIEKGLLRGPDTLGPGASYSEDHALRLRLIRTLRERGDSLEEIRLRMHALGIDEIHKLLRSPGRSRTKPARGSAGEFWHRILVTPDLEFLVREGFSPEALSRIRKLADNIRQYLLGGAHDA